jgi:hypothetical protein
MVARPLLVLAYASQVWRASWAQSSQMNSVGKSAALCVARPEVDVRLMPNSVRAVRSGRPQKEHDRPRPLFTARERTRSPTSWSDANAIVGADGIPVVGERLDARDGGTMLGEGEDFVAGLVERVVQAAHGGDVGPCPQRPASCRSICGPSSEPPTAPSVRERDAIVTPRGFVDPGANRRDGPRFLRGRG